MPAAHNALVGLRGTQGLLSRSGLVPLGHTQDMAAPIARTVTDVAILLDALVGYDPADRQTAEAVSRTPRLYVSGLDAGALQGARIGIVTTLMGAGPEHEEVNAVIRKAAEDMKARGATVVELSIDNIAELIGPDRFKGFIVPAYEVKFDLAAYFASLPNKPPASTIDQLLAAPPPPLATFWLKNAQSIASLDAKEYTDALLRRSELRQTLLAAMASQRVDVLAYPTYLVKPVLLSGEEKAESNNCQVGPKFGPAVDFRAGRLDARRAAGRHRAARARLERGAPPAHRVLVRAGPRIIGAAPSSRRRCRPTARERRGDWSLASALAPGGTVPGRAILPDGGVMSFAEEFKRSFNVDGVQWIQGGRGAGKADGAGDPHRADLRPRAARRGPVPLDGRSAREPGILGGQRRDALPRRGGGSALRTASRRPSRPTARRGRAAGSITSSSASRPTSRRTSRSSGSYDGGPVLHHVALTVSNPPRPRRDRRGLRPARHPGVHERARAGRPTSPAPHCRS